MRHDIKQIHFYSLCEEVKKKCSFELTNISHTEHLSDQIFERTRKRLSSSTLYRILISEQNKHIPYLSTLDILADFVGQQDWVSFCQQHEVEPVLSSQQKLVPDAMGLQLLKICLDNHHFKSVLEYLKILEGPYLDDWKAQWQLGEILGKNIRKDKQAQRLLLPELAKIPQGRFFFYENFVDEDHLAGYFGNSLDLYAYHQFNDFNQQEIQDKIFVQSLQFLSHYLRGEIKEAKKIGYELFSIPDERISITQNIHPHPVGRWYAYRLLYWQITNRLNPANLEKTLDQISYMVSNHNCYAARILLFHVFEILDRLGEYQYILGLFQKHEIDLGSYEDLSLEVENNSYQLILMYTKIALYSIGSDSSRIHPQTPLLLRKAQEKKFEVLTQRILQLERNQNIS